MTDQLRRDSQGAEVEKAKELLRKELGNGVHKSSVTRDATRVVLASHDALSTQLAEARANLFDVTFELAQLKVKPMVDRMREAEHITAEIWEMRFR